MTTQHIPPRNLIVHDGADGARILRRKAWLFTHINEIGQEAITGISFYPLKGGEMITLIYPQYAFGRQGEATYIHLPSLPLRLKHRAKTGALTVVAIKATQQPNIHKGIR